MMAYDNIQAAISSGGVVWRDDAFAELADLRAKLTAALARIAELEAQVAAARERGVIDGKQ